LSIYNPVNSLLELGAERGEGVRGFILWIWGEKYNLHYLKTDRKPKVAIVCR
jgi:hypothetical protein